MIILRNLQERFYSKPLLRKAEKERMAKESGMTLPEWEASRRRAEERLREAEVSYDLAGTDRFRKRHGWDDAPEESLNQLKKKEKLAKKNLKQREAEMGTDKLTKFRENQDAHRDSIREKSGKKIFTKEEYAKRRERLRRSANKQDQLSREIQSLEASNVLQKRVNTLHSPARMLYRDPKIRERGMRQGAGYIFRFAR